LAINTLVLYGIGAAWAFMNTRQTNFKLHLEVPMEDVYSPSLDWTNLRQPGRPWKDQPALGEINRMIYMNAWHVRNIALTKKMTLMGNRRFLYR